MFLEKESVKMELKREITYVEFFDHKAVENICACLTQVPDRVILVGDESDNLPCHCERYEKLFAERGFKNVRFAHEPISKNKLQSIVDALCRIVETYEDCVFGLTGGEDLYLVAMGIVCERYREKNLKMHRFLLSEGYILDCDQDGQTIGKNRQPKLSVEENIRLYGGEVIYDEEKPETTHRWNMNQEFREDICAMWEICCSEGNRQWNAQIEVLRRAAQATPGSGLSVHVARSVVESNLRREGESMVVNDTILDALQEKGLLKHWYIDENVVIVSFKNDQVKACLTTAGQLLELTVYLAALDARDENGKKVYHNSLTGVYIDWDGRLGSANGGEDSHNEIDVLMMHGVVPVFVSCKNGYVDADELYKLNVVAQQFGNSYAKKVLVAPALNTYGKHADYIENRAKDMGICIIWDLPADDPEARSEIVGSFWYDKEE